MELNLVEKFYENIEIVQKEIRETQKENIDQAAAIVAETIKNGGIIQAFGSGHSTAAAMEVTGRAGGYIASKSITDFANYSAFEWMEGIGNTWYEWIDKRENDCFILISNSGRNPLHIEMATRLKEDGYKVIVVTNLKSSMNTTSRHSSGLKLYELADVVLDNCGWDGDSSIPIEELSISVGPTSSIGAAYLLNSVVLKSMEILINQGIEPPIFKSANIDGGPEYNKELTLQFKDRLFRM